MIHDVALFVLAFGTSAALPGPDNLMLFSRALYSNHRSAVLLAVGLVLGKLVLLTLAILGVTATASILGPFLAVVRVAGGAYLVWLATRLWRRAGNKTGGAGDESAQQAGRNDARSGWQDLVLGAMLTLSNPQALVFYIAVLPSVLGTRPITIEKYLVLAAALCAVMATVAGLYISLARRTRTVLGGRAQVRSQRIGAVVLAAVGLAIAFR